MLRLSWVACCATLVGFFLLAPSARAGASDTDSMACGSTASAWNVPNGGLVITRSQGLVDAVLSSVGEYYTHSMLSHGPGGHVTHSTMFTPGTTGWPTLCSTPINATELKSGYPGAAQTSQAGIYTFLYLDGGVEAAVFQRSRDADGLNQHGADIANFLWSDMPYSSVPSRQNGAESIYRLRHHETQAFFEYSLYQYRDQENLNRGVAAWNNGSVCSTFLAYAHHVAGKGTISPHTYSHAQIVASGDALYAKVEDRCNSGTDFLLDVGAAVGCFEGICDDAARQIRNCMARGICNSDDVNRWKEVVNDPKSVAVSISPDRLGGWSGHPFSGEGASVWAFDVAADVQWNSDGERYGCWF